MMEFDLDKVDREVCARSTIYPAAVKLRAAGYPRERAAQEAWDLFKDTLRAS